LFGFDFNKCKIAEVLPTPKKPVIILVGTALILEVDIVMTENSKPKQIYGLNG
jgi:hypothetical protein